MNKYVLTEGIYTNPGSQRSIAYNDGDQAEEYLLTLIREATDISTGSEELMRSIRDWSSLYHLSSRRADLLRPWDDVLKGKKVLEIGSGCGAITRYLGESGAGVMAVEGSYRRAQITRQRCRDLSNVRVVCDNFEDLSITENFDIITLIGVLEYSNLFIHAENPVDTLLQKARSFLVPGGCLIIAIENKLGLKYLAGAPEDHIGKPYFGIENKYSQSTVITFGKEELKQLLFKTGFTESSFLYPFPDYKLPRVILTEAGVQNNTLHKEDLLVEKFEYVQTHVYENHFSTTLAAGALAQNGLLPHLSNSFLVAATCEKKAEDHPGNILAYTYSTMRKKPYCKENIFITHNMDEVYVIKKLLYPLLSQTDPLIKQKVESEPYYKGRLLFRDAVSVTSMEGWTVQDLGKWASFYYRILLSHAFQKEGQWFLPGKFIDLTPFNIILGQDDENRAFDQEWMASDAQPIHYIFFRGIRYSLGDILFFTYPHEEVPLNIIDLVVSVINKVIPFGKELVEDCVERENKYFSAVVIAPISSFDFGNIHIRGLRKSEKKLAEALERTNEEKKEYVSKNDELKTEISLINNELGNTQYELGSIKGELLRTKEKISLVNNELGNTQYELGSIKGELTRTKKDLTEEKHKVRELERDKEWYVRTYEKKGILGIVKDRILSFFSKMSP